MSDYQKKKLKRKQRKGNKRMNDKKKMPISFPVQNLGAPQGQQPPFDLSEAKPLECLGCKGVFFDKVFRMGLISQFAPGNKTGKDIPVEYPTYVCRDCGTEVRKEPATKQ